MASSVPFTPIQRPSSRSPEDDTTTCDLNCNDFDFPKAMAKLAFKISDPQIRPHFFSRLPRAILKRVLKFLLVSTKPLFLRVDAETPDDYSTGLDTAILTSCRYLSNVGIEILYSGNTFTTSSPATSANFDKHLLKLPGRNLQLIRHIKLDIDWADELWTKFPLIASVLGSVHGLKSLRITILTSPRTQTTKDAMGSASGSMAMRSEFPRNGAAAEVMMKAEKRVFKNLILGLRALKVFRLRGFADKEFAKDLERYVASGRRMPVLL